MKKSMKSSMKAKTMKKASGMKKRGMKKSVSKIGKGKLAKVSVFKGRKEKTVGGLKKSDLTKNKNGKIVSKKKNARGKNNKWANAFRKARAALKIKGFCPCGGKTAQGKALLAKTRSFYKK